jgi:hypothetical protein
VLQRRYECKLDTFSGEVSRLGRGVGVGLEPAELGGGRSGREIEGQLPATAPLDRGEASVCRDLVEPRADEAAVIEAATVRQARIRLSCTTSSASCNEPSIR